ncbi:MAG: VanZ family protein [bacterium]
MKLNPKIYHSALILYCAAIFIQSSFPSDSFPSVGFEFADKVVHFIIYAVLFVLFFYSLKNQSKNVKLQKYSLEYALLFTVLYGMTDEIHQYFVPNRSCEFSDWVADALGALTLYFMFKYIYKRKTILPLLLVIFSFMSCSSSNNSGNSPAVNVSGIEAWLNLMPVVGEQSNILGFTLDIEIKGSAESRYEFKDFVILFDNGTVTGKKFAAEDISTNQNEAKFKINQIPGEIYLTNSDNNPKEVQFRFTVYDGNKKIKLITTPKIKLQTVY